MEKVTMFLVAGACVIGIIAGLTFIAGKVSVDKIPFTNSHVVTTK